VHALYASDEAMSFLQDNAVDESAVPSVAAAAVLADDGQDKAGWSEFRLSPLLQLHWAAVADGAMCGGGGGMFTTSSYLGGLSLATEAECLRSESLVSL